MTHRARFRNTRSGISYIARNNEAKSEDNGLDGFEKMMSLAVKLSIATGFLIVFIYCFFEINWFPIGLSLSDTVGFIMVALGLGMVMLVIALPLLIATFAVIEEGNKNNGYKNFPFWIKFCFCAILAFIIVKRLGENKDHFYTSLIWFYIITAIIIIIIYFALIKKNKEVKETYLFIIAPLFVMLIFITTLNFGKNIMISLGVARSSLIIQLAEDDYKFVLSEAKRRNLVASTFGGREDRSLSDVSILWRGMGSHTFIEFDDPCKKEKVRMEIKTDESKIIYSVKDNSKRDNSNINETVSEPKANKSDENTCDSKIASILEMQVSQIYLVLFKQGRISLNLASNKDVAIQNNFQAA